MPSKKALIPLLLLIICFSTASGQSRGSGSDISAREVAAVAWKKGDVNQDGAVNIFDLLTLLPQLAGTVPGTTASDVNGNGKTDIFDLLDLLHELVNPGEARNLSWSQLRLARID